MRASLVAAPMPKSVSFWGEEKINYLGNEFSVRKSVYQCAYQYWRTFH